MPNRIIKESIRTSKTVNTLTDFQFRMWVYLITYADDYGRGSADPDIIKGFVFPKRKGVTEAQILRTLDELATIGMIQLYEVDGDSFFCFPTWDKHQRVQSKKPKFPAPEESTVSHGESRKLTVSHGEPPQVTETNGNPPPESESNPNPNPNPESESKTARTAQADEPDLSAFGSELQKAVTEWLAYKKEKGNTYKPTGLTRLLTQIKNYAGQYGEAEIVKLIETCEARNYQGIIFDLLDKKKPSGSAQRFSGNYDCDEEGGGFF